MKWWVSEINDPEGHILVADRDGLVAAVTIKEDADLIAAAPDMLEALEWAAEWAQESEAGRDDAWWAGLDRVKSTISKAKGESK